MHELTYLELPLRFGVSRGNPKGEQFCSRCRMDDLERILRSPYIAPPTQEAVGMAFARVWGYCASRFDHLPAQKLDRAQQRLAALLVLIALSSESATSAAERIASNEIVDLIC